MSWWKRWNADTVREARSELTALGARCTVQPDGLLLVVYYHRITTVHSVKEVTQVKQDIVTGHLDWPTWFVDNVIMGENDGPTN